ncbi:MAG: hypothetical protein M3X11_01370 [Acidobacteriota bacterium]|nr:hypothetical protein [Acidobacteriota bacterium]
MADATDVLLKFCEQQWTEAKQSEDQRATFTNIILLIASAVVGVIAQKGMSKGMLPISILLILLGIFGAVVSRKLYERHQFHIARLRGWRGRVMELHPDAQLDDLKKLAVEMHDKAFPVMSSVRLNHLWIILHATVAMAGVILTIVIAIKS